MVPLQNAAVNIHHQHHSTPPKHRYIYPSTPQHPSKTPLYLSINTTVPLQNTAVSIHQLHSTPPKHHSIYPSTSNTTVPLQNTTVSVQTNHLKMFLFFNSSMQPLQYYCWSVCEVNLAEVHEGRHVCIFVRVCVCVVCMCTCVCVHVFSSPCLYEQTYTHCWWCLGSDSIVDKCVNCTILFHLYWISGSRECRRQDSCNKDPHINILESGGATRVTDTHSQLKQRKYT